MSIVMIAILAVVVVVLVLIVGMVASGAIICGDLMSYTATGAETMSPVGAVTGNALVVYQPGVTGAARTEASEIASDLKAEGYNVTLAGIRSAAAANTSGYDIVIVGGPVYFGTVSSSTAAYLKGLTLQQDARLGVFGTTGSNDFVASDLTSVEKQVATLQSGKSAVVRLIGDRDEKKATKSCLDFVAALIK